MANYIIGEQTARKLNALMTATALGARRVSTTASADCDMPSPFAVAWSQQQNSGAGAWVIWLPQTSGLISIDGTDLNATTPLAAATGMPTGWYVLGIAANATAVYLAVTTSAGSGTMAVSYAAASVSGASNFLLATMSASTTGGKLVKQIQVGPVRTGGVAPDASPLYAYFEIYKDTDAQGNTIYKMRDGVVSLDGSTNVTVTQAGALTVEAQYYCRIDVNAATWAVNATIVRTAPHPSYDGPRWYVPIGKVTQGGTIIQQHLGAIVIRNSIDEDGQSLTYERVPGDGTNSLAIKGFWDGTAQAYGIPYKPSDQFSIGWANPPVEAADGVYVLAYDPDVGLAWRKTAQMDVITRSEYNASTRTFTNYKKTVNVLLNASGSTPSETAVVPSVFVASPHNVSGS